MKNSKFQFFLQQVEEYGGKKLVRGHATRAILGMVYNAYEFTKARSGVQVLNLYASRDDSGFRENVYKPLFSHAEYCGVDMWQDKFIYEGKKLADSHTLPFADNTFDAVMTTKVLLEHVSEPELTLREIKRVLKPGGEAFLLAPFITIAHQAPYDFFRYTEYGLRHLFKKTGFDVVSLERSNSDFMTTMDARAMFSSMGILPWAARRMIAVYTKHIRYPIARFLDRFIPNQGRFTKYYICRVKKI
ncbi:MAG: class I SAM-dependent methyltransferase [Candidatus Sungbacteria bacterium]|nr:class I SAM-dependent methyltransferase [Candidatus Sungbacteria bacterium]